MEGASLESQVWLCRGRLRKWLALGKPVFPRLNDRCCTNVNIRSIWVLFQRKGKMMLTKYASQLGVPVSHFLTLL